MAAGLTDAYRLTALVTGGTRGIGLAVVRGLASRGLSVYLGARDMAEGERQASTIRGANRNVRPIALDLTDPASIQKAIEDLSRVEIDVLINNAGVMTYGSLVDMPWDDIRRSLEVHVEGPLRLIRALVPKMVTRDYGRIVNVSSGSGAFAEGLGQLGAYNFTKAALNALTVSVALTVPSSVKVNAMCPGWCRTRMGGWNAARSADEGADTVIWLATVPRTGPTGGFFRDRAPIPW